MLICLLECGVKLRPALTDRKGWAIFIGTPKGRNQFWQLYEDAKHDSEWHRAIYRASETGVVDAKELEGKKTNGRR